MAQVVARLDDKLTAELDGLVADGVATSRSDAVRIGLERLIDEHRRQRIGTAIADAYRRQPQTSDELGGLDQATRALIEAEPW
jgi:Arc/MetJ-type ribon-helix-helix transcriptional regulator